MKDMTREQIIKAGKKYDNLHNEGGEGYNPYWSEIDRREIEEANTRPETKHDKIEELQKKIRTNCGSVAREWGNTEEIDSKQAEYYSEIKCLEMEIEAEFLTEWTLEETKSRRIIWNNFVRAEFVGGSMTPDRYRKLHAKRQELGWGREELKTAIKLHNL